MEPSKIKPNTGRILISVPFLQDFYFKKSVVLLAEHSDEGSFGIIVNKPVEVKLSDIASEFAGFNAPVFLGGPVKTDSLFFLHTRPDLIDEGIPILDGIYWGGNIDTVRQLINEKRIKENEIRFFIGYSGWVADQLNKELEERSWVVSLTNSAQIFKSNPTELWSQTLKKLGKEYKFWTVYPANPMYN